MRESKKIYMSQKNMCESIETEVDVSKETG